MQWGCVQVQQLQTDQPWAWSLCADTCSFSGAVKEVPRNCLWLPCAGTKQWQQVPVLKAVWPYFSAGEGVQWLWFKPFRAGGMDPGLSPPGWSRWWKLIKKSRTLLCFIVPECLENSGAIWNLLVGWDWVGWVGWEHQSLEWGQSHSCPSIWALFHISWKGPCVLKGAQESRTGGS